MLRVIAGLEAPDAGQVFLSGADVTKLEPHKRDVNTVFQNYALFPHMDVKANIGYSLRLKRAPKHEIRRAVAEALDLVRLSGYQDRMPGELSGGQRQRVAIARAIIQKPKILLLDEPLGALDLQLRRLMQAELKKLQRQLGITFIYITHDQEEALTMSDRIAVMRDGHLLQTGTAAEVYDRPRTSYVARFVGNANLLEGRVTGKEGSVVSFICHGAEVRAEIGGTGRSYERGDSITVAVRGEGVDVFRDGSNGGIPVLVTGKSFAGGMLRMTMSPIEPPSPGASMEAADGGQRPNGGAEVVAGRHGIDSPFSPGQNAWINWAPERAVPVDADR